MLPPISRPLRKKLLARASDTNPRCCLSAVSFTEKDTKTDARTSSTIMSQQLSYTPTHYEKSSPASRNEAVQQSPVGSITTTVPPVHHTRVTPLRSHIPLLPLAMHRNLTTSALPLDTCFNFPSRLNFTQHTSFFPTSAPPAIPGCHHLAGGQNTQPPISFKNSLEWRDARILYPGSSSLKSLTV